MTNGLTQKHDRELADSVLEVSVKANMRVVEELRGDESMCQALLEIMEPEIKGIVDAAVKATAKDEAKKRRLICWNRGSFPLKRFISIFPDCP